MRPQRTLRIRRLLSVRAAPYPGAPVLARFARSAARLRQKPAARPAQIPYATRLSVAYSAHSAATGHRSQIFTARGEFAFAARPDTPTGNHQSGSEPKQAARRRQSSIRRVPFIQRRHPIGYLFWRTRGIVAPGTQNSHSRVRAIREPGNKRPPAAIGQRWCTCNGKSWAVRPHCSHLNPARPNISFTNRFQTRPRFGFLCPPRM